MPKATRAPRGARRLPDDESVAGSAVELVKNAEPPREKRQPRRTKERPGKALAAQDADELEAPEPDDADVVPRRRRKRRRTKDDSAPRSISVVGSAQVERSLAWWSARHSPRSPLKGKRNARWSVWKRESGTGKVASGISGRMKK